MSSETVSNQDNVKPGRRKKRPLGGDPQKGTALAGAANALGELKGTEEYIERNKMNIVFLRPKDIKKTFNARFIPCSLEEFASVSWPNLDYDIDAATDLYPSLLEPRSWYKALNEQQQADFIVFLQRIHSTAQSIHSSRQLHPITAEREHAASDDAYIVDGERRTLSVLYSRGKIPYVKAQIFDYMLDKEARARLKDEANDVPPLNDFEVLDSKLARLDASSDLMTMTLRPLGKELKINKERAAIVKDVAKHPQREALFDRFRNERISWANMRVVLDNGIDTRISKANVSSKDSKPATSKVGELVDSAYGDSLKSIGKNVGGHLGYGCSLKYNAKKDSVKLSLDCPKEKLEELLGLLGYQDETR